MMHRRRPGGSEARPARWVSPQDDCAIVETHALACRHFGPTIDPRRYADILAAAHPVLACTFDDEGHVTGYLDVFPLNPSAVERLYAGCLREAELGPDHVHTVTSLATADRVVWYVGGIAVQRPGSLAGGRDAAALLALLLATARAFEHAGRSIELVAARASGPGARLIARLGGVAIPGAAVDGFPLFRLSLA